MKFNKNDINNNSNFDKKYSSHTESNSVNGLSIYLNNIDKKLLSSDEEKIIGYKILEGDELAKKTLVERNLKLVVSIAKKYSNIGIDLDDLIQEGNIGLMYAADRFDVRKDIKFSTYATYWIRQFINRLVYNTNRNIRIPDYYSRKIIMFKKVQNELIGTLGRYPSIEEIAYQLGITTSEATEIFQKIQDTVSINNIIDNDEETEMGEIIPDDKITVENVIINEMMKKEINDFLDNFVINGKLNKRSIYIIKERFGLNGNDIKTLDDLGKELNLTRERVRQLESEALNIIRLSKNVDSFSTYMDSPDKVLDYLVNYRKKYYDNLGNSQKNKEKKNMNKMSHTIYRTFSEYSKETINLVINQLSDEDKELLRIRYGEDLENPQVTELWKSKKYNNAFYRGLLPKIRELLQNIKTTSEKENLSQDNIELEKKDLSDKDLALTSNKANDSDISFISNTEYTKFLNIIKSPLFSNIRCSLSNRDKIIISLKLGFVNDKKYSAKEISDFLEIDVCEVLEVVKKFLIAYKEEINNYIDEVIDISTEKKYVLEKKEN